MSEEEIFPPVRSRTEEELEAALANAREPRTLPLMPDWRMGHVEQGDEALAQAMKYLQQGTTDRAAVWAATASAHYQAAGTLRP